MTVAAPISPTRRDMSSPDRMIRRARPSLRSNAVWTATGNGIYALGQWGVVIVLARLGDTAAVGNFALAAAITAPIVLCANCALRTVQATDVDRKFAPGDYAAFRSVSSLLAAAVVLAAAFLFTSGAIAWWTTILVGLGKLVEAVSDLPHGQLWRHERLDLIGKSLMMRGLATPAAAALGLASGGGVIGAVVAICAAWLAILVLYDFPAAFACSGSCRRPLRSQVAFDRARLRSLFIQVWPMGLTVLLGSLILNVPRYAVERYLGIEQLGVFAALAYLAMIGNLAATTAAQIALPRQSRFHAAGDARGFVVLTAALTAAGAVVGALLAAIAWAVGPALLALVYGPAYADQGAVLALSVAAVGFGAIVCFLDHALYAARRFRVQLPVNLAIAAVTVAVAFWSTRRFGLVGAAGAACISMAVAAAVRLPIVVAAVRAMNEAANRPATAVSESPLS
jgi:O-antigen/teichoic acid export membrane protein